MDAKEHLQAGRLPEALAALQQGLRKNPADVGLHIFHFELSSLLGDWEKALRHLQIVTDLDCNSVLLAQGFRPAIQCEALRADVFSGKRTPLIFGEPEPWMSWLVQANHPLATGQVEASQELREKALADAPASAGQINGEAFEWIADADSRLGPMLEVLLEGKYYWVPFARIASVQLETPKNLRDLVWIGAQFTWSNGGNATGLIPVRYVGTERSDESALRLARKTEWIEKSPGVFAGIGQRMLATDKAEYSLLEIREVVLQPAPEGVTAPPAGATE
jgi:type VI secretion system protein ImpE